MKIDIGGGEHTKEGFKNVDKYHPPADFIADVIDLPFDDASIEEAHSKHMFEHLPKRDVKKAFSEVYRVLINGAKFTVIVPDMEWCAVNWAISTDKKGRSLDWIYGGQIYEGDFHKTGYTLDTLSFFLEEAGFNIIEKKKYMDFDFQALHIEAIKP